MRRTALGVGCLLLVVAAATVSPAFAQPTASSPTDVAADFNRDGFADLAIGVPGEAIGGAQNEIAGAVNVLYGAGEWAERHRWAALLPGRGHGGVPRSVRVGAGGRGLQR
jgi:hypothetical protein